uniref:Lipocalin n=1 Tax=Rhipicephalus appendiculatus TaxID=34631 RepID=A0A131YFK9_RHIAP
MLKITVLALVLTTTGELRNAAEAKQSKAPGSTSEASRQHKFKEFWNNYKKVWTANSTVPFYDCEWEEPANMSESEDRLQIITHFGIGNSFTLNWTFSDNDTMTSELPEGVFTRYMEYQNGTCAVFKDEYVRKSPPNEEADKKKKKKKNKKSKKEKEKEDKKDSKKKKKKSKKEKKKKEIKGVDYRMVFDDTKIGHVPNDCREKYRNVIGQATNHRIYKRACRNAQAKKNPKEKEP